MTIAEPRTESDPPTITITPQSSTYYDPDQAPTDLPLRPLKVRIEMDRRGIDWRRRR